jgi:hypothetical protein
MTPDEAEAIGARIAEARSWRYDDGSIDLNVLGGLIAAALLEAAGGWNADMDAAPRDGTPVLLCDARTGSMRWAVWAIHPSHADTWDGDFLGWRDGTLAARGEIVGVIPTHWRHLPAPADVPDATA